MELDLADCAVRTEGYFDWKCKKNGRATHYTIDARGGVRRELPVTLRESDIIDAINIDGPTTLVVTHGANYRVRRIKGRSGNVDLIGPDVRLRHFSNAVKVFRNGQAVNR